MEPKSNHWCFIGREDTNKTQKEEGHVKIEAEIGVRVPQAKNTRSHQKLKEARKDSPLEALERAWPC